MNTKRNFLIICIASLVLLLSACGATNAPAPQAPEIPEVSGDFEGQSFGAVPCYFPDSSLPGGYRPETCLGLQYGDKKPWVGLLQEWLLRNGFDVGPYGADGDFGPATYNAVIRFQESRGLVVDGYVGTCTWTALFFGYNWLCSG